MSEDGRDEGRKGRRPGSASAPGRETGSARTAAGGFPEGGRTGSWREAAKGAFKSPGKGASTRWNQKRAKGAGSGRGAPRAGSAPRGAERAGEVVLYGWHPVFEALSNPKREVRRLLATENGERRLREALRELRVTPQIVRPDEIGRLVEADAVHQGLYLEAEPLRSPRLDSLPDDALLIALDQITDPHNVGAITRSAAAFGVAAIVTTARHSPAATGVLAKAASGGLEHVPFIVVTNLAETLIALGKSGVQRIGFDSEGTTELSGIAVRRPAVLVLGAEGKGLRQRTRDNCDVIARLDMPGAIKSLNVSNAAAVALYALSRGS